MYLAGKGLFLAGHQDQTSQDRHPSVELDLNVTTALDHLGEVTTEDPFNNASLHQIELNSIESVPTTTPMRKNTVIVRNDRYLQTDDELTTIDESWLNIDSMDLDTLIKKSGLDELVSSIESNLDDDGSYFETEEDATTMTYPDEPSTDDLIENVETYLQSVSGGIPTSYDDTTMDEEHQDAISAAAQDLIDAIRESKPDFRSEVDIPVMTSTTTFFEEVKNPQQPVIPSLTFSGSDACNNAALSAITHVKAEKHMKEEEFVTVETADDVVEVGRTATAEQSADTILNALVTGQVAEDCGLNLTPEELRNAVTTTAVGVNGEQVIIIITKPIPTVTTPPGYVTVEVEQPQANTTSSMMPSPSHHWILKPDEAELGSPSFTFNEIGSPISTFTEIGSPQSSQLSIYDKDDFLEVPASPATPASSIMDADNNNDSDWAPSPCVVRKRKLSTMSTSSSVTASEEGGAARRKYQRKNPRVPAYLSLPYPEDKDERKKAQNKTAAYRYRQKKQAEQEILDAEVAQLTRKNLELKSQFNRIVTDLKCMKKLLTQTGLGHIAKAVKI